MSLDTVDKRSSAVAYPMPFAMLGPEPDGVIAGAGDRAQILYLYRGVAVAPTILSATVAADGNSVTLLWSEAVVFGAGGNVGFSMLTNRGAATLTYLSGASSTSLVYTTGRTIDLSETGTVSYVQPGNGAEGAGGDDVNSFTGFVINNTSTADAIPPTLQSGSIDVDADTIAFVFDEDVTFGAGGNGGFTIDMSGGAATLTYSSGDGSRTLVYDISRAVADTETGTFDYTQPSNGVEDIAGNDLASIVDRVVNFTAELEHNNPSMRHLRLTLDHKKTDIYHNDPTVDHNR